MSDFYPEDTILRSMTYQDAILILQNVNPEYGDIWSQMKKELRKRAMTLKKRPKSSA